MGGRGSSSASYASSNSIKDKRLQQLSEVYKVAGTGDGGKTIRIYGPKNTWANFDYTGKLLSRSKDSDFIGTLTEKNLSEMKELATLVKKPKYGTDVYIRFSELPKGGKSTNFATGEKEKGVSVYQSHYNYVTGNYSTYGALAGAEISHVLRGSNAYLVKGTEVGMGSDGEPVISNAKVLKKLKRTGTSYA